MAIVYNPKIVTDGLTLALDAGNVKSYNNTAITYVGGTSDSDNSSSFTLSGLQSGDLVLYFSAEDNTPVATPTGASWTAIPGLTTQPDNDLNPNSAAFYVFANGTSVTASGLNTGDEQVRVMIAFRNVSPTNPFDVNATENSASTDIPNPPSITPVTNNSMIVAVGFIDDDDVANTITPPTGYTTAVNMDSQGGATDSGAGGATIMTAYKLLATAAAEDPGAFISSSSSAGSSEPNKGISIALRPETVSISTTWTDLSGKGNNVTLTGTTFNSSNSGFFVFNGSSNYVREDTILDTFTATTDPWSVECWFNTDVNPSVIECIIGINYNNGAENTLLLGVINVGGTCKINVYYRDGLPLGSFGTVTVGQWHHVVATHTSGSLKVYLDGTQIASDSNTVNRSLSDCAFLIGAELDSGNSLGNYFDGKISNVKMYNKELTATEIAQNFNALKGRYA